MRRARPLKYHSRQEEIFNGLLSVARLRRGLHRNPLDHQARVHRAGDQGSDLLRSHPSDSQPGVGGRRDSRPEQGEAAARHGHRGDEQLQLEGNDVQHLSNVGPLDQHAGLERAGRLDQRRCRRTVVRQHSRSEHRRAGDRHRQPGAGLPAIPRGGPAGVQRLADRLHGLGQPDPDRASTPRCCCGSRPTRCRRAG